MLKHEFKPLAKYRVPGCSLLRRAISATIPSICPELPKLRHSANPYIILPTKTTVQKLPQFTTYKKPVKDYGDHDDELSEMQNLEKRNAMMWQPNVLEGHREPTVPNELFIGLVQRHPARKRSRDVP